MTDQREVRPGDEDQPELEEEAEKPETINAWTLETDGPEPEGGLRLVSGPPTVDAAWVESRVQAIRAVEPFLGRPQSVSWLELPARCLEDDRDAELPDRRLPFLVVIWPENNAGWSDEWTLAIPAGGDVGEYLEAVREPLGL